MLSSFTYCNPFTKTRFGRNDDELALGNNIVDNPASKEN